MVWVWVWRIVVSISVVYSRDHMADWELWFAVTVQPHERILYCILLALEKVKIQSTASTRCVLF